MADPSALTASLSAAVTAAIQAYNADPSTPDITATSAVLSSPDLGTVTVPVA